MFDLLILQRAGIEKLIPDMVIDDYAFEPCGYSMNGISKHGVSKEFTIISNVITIILLLNIV